MNHDATADPEWLKNLYTVASKAAADDRVGMWGGPILRPHCPDRMSSAGHAIRSRDGAFLDIDWNRPVTDRDAFSQRSGFVPFCPCFAAALWAVEMLRDVGLPDNDQFLYYDDVDLAYRARLNRWNVRYVSAAIAYHPLPNSKKPTPSARRWQTIGRLTIVARYFPEPQRSQILENLSPEERETFKTVDERRLKPESTETERRRVFHEWKDRNRPK